MSNPVGNSFVEYVEFKKLNAFQELSAKTVGGVSYSASLGKALSAVSQKISFVWNAASYLIGGFFSAGRADCRVFSCRQASSEIAIRFNELRTGVYSYGKHVKETEHLLKSLGLDSSRQENIVKWKINTIKTWYEGVIKNSIEEMKEVLKGKGKSVEGFSPVNYLIGSFLDTIIEKKDGHIKLKDDGQRDFERDCQGIISTCHYSINGKKALVHKEDSQSLEGLAEALGESEESDWNAVIAGLSTQGPRIALKQLTGVGIPENYALSGFEEVTSMSLNVIRGNEGTEEIHCVINSSNPLVNTLDHHKDTGYSCQMSSSFTVKRNTSEQGGPLIIEGERYNMEIIHRD